jgi:uncharacterized membrane protein
MASELIVTCYPNADIADRVVEAGRRLVAAGLVKMDAAVVVRRDDDGNIKIYHLFGRGLKAVIGGLFWGTLLGEAPIDEGFVRQLTERLGPNTSMLFALVQRTGGSDRVLAAPEKVLPELAEFGGTLLHTTLPSEMDERIQTQLDEAHRHVLDLRAEAAASSRRRRVVAVR